MIASFPDQFIETASSRHALDWTNFFLADVQTGLGAFVAFYLAGLGWHKGQVGAPARWRRC